MWKAVALAIPAAGRSLPHKVVANGVSMKDLTQGPTRSHLVRMAAPIAMGMVAQTLYYLIDLYFVSRLGDDAVAGVSAAGTLVALVTGLTQMLAVGTLAPIAQAVGAKDRSRANRMFGQAVLLAATCAFATLLLGLPSLTTFMHGMSASPAAEVAGADYLRWYLPGLALSFPLTAASCALQATGLARPVMVARVAALLANLVLAPVLIAGWGTGRAMGAAGAGLASSVASAIGLAMTAKWFILSNSTLTIGVKSLRPDGVALRRIVMIGTPVGVEFVLVFLLNAATFVLLRRFGADVQSGYGVGARVLEAILTPAAAVAFAVPAVAGQNIGAGLATRARDALRHALQIELALTVPMVILCQMFPEALVSPFTRDLAAAGAAARFLSVVSWNFPAIGIVFGCSGMFQASGETWPGLASSALRSALFLIPALLLESRSEFSPVDIWLLSVATTPVQAVFSVLMARGQLRRLLAR